MFRGRLAELITTVLERVAENVARRLGRAGAGPAHLATGRRGEQLAYFFLRRQGYVVVARNWRCRGRKGELDLVGWDGDVLCFIEVKTRGSRAVATAEAAVDRAKQRELRGMAALYLRRCRPRPPTRFDVVSVYLLPGLEPEIELFKNAFSWRTISAKRRPRW